MKVRYIKKGKFNYNGNQYPQGRILEVESLESLPEGWFEKVEEIEVIETIEPIERTEKIVINKIKKTKEEILNVGNKNSN